MAILAVFWAKDPGHIAEFIYSFTLHPFSLRVQHTGGKKEEEKGGKPGVWMRWFGSLQFSGIV